MPNFKGERWHCKPYRKWIAEKPCLHCGRTDVQCAHITVGRFAIGTKPPDYLCIPLCIQCHVLFDENQKADVTLLARCFIAAAGYYHEWTTKEGE